MTDNITSTRSFRLVYQADDGYTYAVRITAESESGARQWFIDMTADDFAVEAIDCLGHTINELGAEDHCAIGSGRDVFLLSVDEVALLPPVTEEDGAYHFDAPLTVAQLRSLLVGLDDDTQVLLAGPQGLQNADWYNVDGIALPNDDGIIAFTLFPADTYDSRQF